MSKQIAFFSLAALATLAACGEGPSGVSDSLSEEIVITEGITAPAPVVRTRPVFSDVTTATASLGGSVITPLSLKAQSCTGNEQQVVITFTVTGNQVGTATFDVDTRWEYGGATWTSSIPTTASIPPRAGGSPGTVRQVTITVVNASNASSGTANFSVAPYHVTNSNTTGAKLGSSGAASDIFVTFEACPVTNTAPTLVVPDDITVEATSSAGAAVSYVVTANDLEDGNLSGSVVCAPASGTTFALGTTTVNCEVTDNGGLKTTGSFDITVEDTTPAYFTSFPSGTVNLIAANINGAVLDVDALGIAVEDVGNVSDPSTYACDYVAGTVLAIGSTTTVSCTATDAIGNESVASTFDVFVGLNVNATGFLPPLRMVAPFSSHKRGSTIPHKFLPPTYADGTPAIDLADGLHLTIKRIDPLPESDAIVADVFVAGSTSWRYDADGGHYIFNLKTGTSTPWDLGTWVTTVSYGGITLATTQFELRR